MNLNLKSSNRVRNFLWNGDVNDLRSSIVFHVVVLSFMILSSDSERRRKRSSKIKRKTALHHHRNYASIIWLDTKKKYGGICLISSLIINMICDLQIFDYPEWKTQIHISRRTYRLRALDNFPRSLLRNVSEQFSWHIPSQRFRKSRLNINLYVLFISVTRADIKNKSMPRKTDYIFYIMSLHISGFPLPSSLPFFFPQIARYWTTWQGFLVLRWKSSSNE